MSGLAHGDGGGFGVGVEMWPGSRGQTATWYDVSTEVAWMFGGKQAQAAATATATGSGSVLLDELWSFAPDDFAACSTAPLDSTVNLTTHADVSACALSSAQRLCVVESCSTDYMSKGIGQVECIVDNSVASLLFTHEAGDSSFTCIECVEQAAAAVSCTASTEYAPSYSCDKVYDGNFRQDVGEWSTAGEGGGWVRIEYDGTYRIDSLNFQQRWREMDWATSVSIDFSDGSSQSLALIQSADIQSYSIDPVFTSSAIVTITGVRSSYSNVGATEIRELQ